MALVAQQAVETDAGGYAEAVRCVEKHAPGEGCPYRNNPASRAFG